MPNEAFIEELRSIVGRRHLITDPGRSEPYRKGYRSGGGAAEAVVRPGSLLELWRVLQAAVAANRIIIMQAANTGLTEGSTPSGDYDREVLVVNTLRLDKLHVLKEGRQVVSHAGGTLYRLERLLAPYGRQPHSVIGSSCIGASVVGGICNNSGGALVRRGPAYTELALFAQLRADGRLELVNHLGVALGDTPEEICTRLERGDFTDADVADAPARASDDAYEERVRDVDAPSPARYNADPRCLHEAAGSAGKLAVFAVRLDTFPAERDPGVYYVGTDSPAALSRLRRRMLTEFDELPISAEYLHRDIFDVARRYGKDTLLVIHWFGTDVLPAIFALKGRMDARFKKLRVLPANLVDRTLQLASRLLPEALPKRLLEFRDRFEHHLIVKVAGEQREPTEALLRDELGDDGWFRCDAAEAKKAMLHRFAAAGAAVRYQAVHADRVEEILALDIALRRNDDDWLETLPPHLEEKLEHKLYYGHFLCHVFHQDYVVRKGVDVEKLKAEMLELLDRRGAKYPAEHNVGHLYEAEPALREFYARLDPTNSFNPGIGKTSKQKAAPATVES